jgi:O-antigen/teichoic acid export membrane protein
VVVGKFYSPATLGQYTRANQFPQLLSNNLTSVIQRVTYPVLSNIHDDKERMKRAYQKMIKTTMFISAVSLLFLGAVSEPLIYCLIGPKWHEAAIYLPLICLPASAYPLHAINLNMLKVQGRSDLFLGLEIIKKIIAIGPLFIGAFIGIIPMLYTYLLTSFISYLLNSHYSGKLLNYSSWMQMKDVAPSYGTALIVALSIYFLKYLPISYWFILPMQLLMGCAVFFIVCHLIKPEEYSEIKSIIVPLIKKKLYE